MPFFQVLIEGTNLNITSGEGTPPMVGFFASRVVWSNTCADAEAKALESVRKLWSNGSYAAQPSSGQLSLSISESGPSTLLQWLRAPNKGHSFFPEENRGDA